MSDTINSPSDKLHKDAIEDASARPLNGRKKIVMIPTSYVLSLFTRPFCINQYLRVPEFTGLPETANAVGVWHDYERDSFAVVVEDASFDQTPECNKYPQIDISYRIMEKPFGSNDHAIKG